MGFTFMSFQILIIGTVIIGVRLLNVSGLYLLMEDNRHIECEYCFGAKELTSNGRLFIPCPVCKGGELEGKELAKANRKWLTDLNNELDNYKDEGK
jgi:Zn finger protein HypA/HybF involved in hydrogenase expression